MKTVLFVSHKAAQCGVYEFGQSIFDALRLSRKYRFVKAECASLEELHNALKSESPAAVIYNYHPSVLPWLSEKLASKVFRNNIAGLAMPQIGIIHEVTQEVADNATGYRNRILLGHHSKKINSLFDYYIAPDPTLLLKNPLVYKTGRLIPEYRKQTGTPAVTTIGSFGFGTPNKGFENLVTLVQEEFDEAVIRLNIPFATFGDSAGENAKRIAGNCRRIISKPGISIEISHDFLSRDQILDFLADNTLNAFLYEDKSGRGLSSATDLALAVKKPVAVSRCPMFRHILTAKPSVCIEDNSLKQIIQNKFEPLAKISEDWDAANLVFEYERILDSVFYRHGQPAKRKGSIRKRIKQSLNRFFSQPDNTFTWLRNTQAANDDDLTINKSISYNPVELPGEFVFNRILDDAARELYKPAEAKLKELAPATMAKKIARANVQQAFVFDTVYRHLAKYPDAKLLCVGSYEDTASMALRKMGYNVEEVDPMLNYFLQEYYEKPGVKKNNYDIIFSTSVIEHDPDDKSFLECVEGLLKPGGLAVITMDYKDGWKPGDPKPDVDARFYTKHDMEHRVMSYLPESQTIDKGNWDCPDPDFNYLGKYQYTFATLVFRKKL